MSAFFRQGIFFLPRFVRTPVLIMCLMSFVLILVTLSLLPGLQPTIPLFYTLPEANNYLVPKMWLLIFPALAATLVVVHVWLLRFIHTHDRLIVQVFCWQTVIIELLLTLAFVRILLLIK